MTFLRGLIRLALQLRVCLRVQRLLLFSLHLGLPASDPKRFCGKFLFPLVENLSPLLGFSLGRQIPVKLYFCWSGSSRRHDDGKIMRTLNSMDINRLFKAMPSFLNMNTSPITGILSEQVLQYLYNVTIPSARSLTHGKLFY